MANLAVWDYLVIILVLAISASIGIYYRFTGGKQKTLKEYLHADGGSSVGLVSISIMASFVSAITILGVPSEVYNHGFFFCIVVLAKVLAVLLVTYIYLPVFFRLQATSTYEYLERRFGKTLRLSISLCYCFYMMVYMGIVIYAPALALEAVTGISRTGAILTIGIVCTFYASIGGMKAVLMTDVFQATLMYVSVFSVIISTIIEKGSIGEIWRIATEGKRVQIPDFNFDLTVRYSWISLTIGMAMNQIYYFGTTQVQVQRYLSLKTLGEAKKALWCSFPLSLTMTVCSCFAGLAIYSKFYECDPISTQQISRHDQLMPYYVVVTMGHIPGLSGLYVAGILSAVLSSFSAAVNTISAVVLEDYLKPMHKQVYGKPLKEETIPLLVKLIATVFGGVYVGMAFLAEHLGGLIQASQTLGSGLGGPIIGVFTLGMCTTIANQKGVLTGLLCGVSISLWLAFSPKIPPTVLPMRVDGCSANFTLLPPPDHISDNSDIFYLYRISYVYCGVLGLIITLFVGYTVSWFTRTISDDKPKPLDPNLFISPIAKRLQN